MKYLSLYEKNRKFLAGKPKLQRAVLLFNAYLPLLFVVAYPLLWLYGFLGDRFAPTDFVKLFCLPVSALLLVSVLQIAVARPRPYEEEGAGISPLQEKKSRGNSLPSRHLACGSVIAVCALPHLPIVGGFLLVCALALGYLRFAVGWHYPSDLIVGFLLGAGIGFLTFIL